MAADARRQLPKHWHAATVTCPGFLRGETLDICANCAGPLSEHAGWCQTEVEAFRIAALKAAEDFRTNGYTCRCSVDPGTRGDLHEDICIHRILLQVSAYAVGPQMLKAAGGSSYFDGEELADTISDLRTQLQETEARCRRIESERDALDPRKRMLAIMRGDLA